jgi:hypothetical protein
VGIIWNTDTDTDTACGQNAELVLLKEEVHTMTNTLQELNKYSGNVWQVLTWPRKGASVVSGMYLRGWTQAECRCSPSHNDMKGE